jgi:hypothetical protein
MLEVDIGVVRPETALKFLSGYHGAGVFEESG